MAEGLGSNPRLAIGPLQYKSDNTSTADIVRKNITRVMMLSGLGHRARNRNDFANRSYRVRASILLLYFITGCPMGSLLLLERGRNGKS